MLKICTKCKTEKAVSEFWLNSRTQTRRPENAYETQCKKCRLNHVKQKHKTDPEWHKAEQDRTKLRRKHRRQTVLSHYGGKCACCGEDRYEFLAIDHINGGGNKHRRKIGSTTRGHFYEWLLKEGLPEGYRVLCHNCNCSLGFYGYCPHDPNFK